MLLLVLQPGQPGFCHPTLQSPLQPVTVLSDEKSSLGTTKKLNLDFQNSLAQTNYHLPHPYFPSLPPVMCYPAPHQFWALPQPELEHKCEENYPDSKNKFFCRSFFFSSCGQYCSWPCNPTSSLQLTIWQAYFSSVTQQKPLEFFFWMRFLLT